MVFNDVPYENFEREKIQELEEFCRRKNLNNPYVSLLVF